MQYNKELSDRLMREIGLDIDSNRCIIDQDTGMPLEYNGKRMVYEGNKSKTSVPFDPLNNTKMMNHLFSYYAEKVSAESDGERNFTIFYQVKDSDTKNHMEIKDDKGNIISSEQYQNDTLKYADLIFKLNDESVDLSKIDKAMTKERQAEIKAAKKAKKQK